MTDALPASWVETVYRGDDREWLTVINENTGTVTVPAWTPKDLSGYTFLCQMRATPDDTTIMATFAVAFDTDGTDGRLKITLPHAQSISLTPGKVWVDLQLTRTSDSFVHTYLAGKWTVKADVSRAVTP